MNCPRLPRWIRCRQESAYAHTGSAQEALSNAGRHAAGAPVAVSVDHDADTVTLQVTNGPGISAGQRVNGHGPGHGLAGMRERVEVLGGSLSAGPAPGGGFVVSAVLPLGGSA